MEHSVYELRPSAQVVLDKFGTTPLVIAEIGVREGQNTIAMLKFLSVKHIFMVDSYDPYYSNEHDHSSVAEQEIWYKNMFWYMNSYFSLVTLVTKPSKFAAELFPEDFFDYVYIDANHSGKSVYEDMTLWYPKVKEGGILGGHDFDDRRFPEVPLAVERFCTERHLTLNNLKNDWMVMK